MLFHTHHLLALTILLVSCSKSATRTDNAGKAITPLGDTPRGALVARVGKVELREDDVQRAMARDPGAAPQRFDSAESRRELVDGLVRFELLAQAAERAGFTKDPDAIHALQQIAVTKLVNQTLGKAAAPESITKADIEREYSARQASDFTLPEAVQIRHIQVSDQKQAERLATQAKALPSGDDNAFAQLATRTTEDAATRAQGGDLGYLDKNSRQPQALLDAALALQNPGDIAGPIPIGNSYEILRLVARRAAAVSPLSSVEEPLRQRLYRERRAKALEDFIARLRKETPVTIPNAKP